MAVATDKANARLGGAEIIFDENPCEWSLVAGVQPHIQSFTLAPKDAEALAGKRAPVSLEINPVKGAPVKVDNLWVLKVRPGSVPYLSEVVVADRRWFWHFKHVTRRYNMRRNVGTKRLLANDLQLQVNFDRAPNVAYWRWSVSADGRTPLNPVSIMTDVMSDVAQVERNYWGQTFKAVLDSRIGTRIATMPIEELQLDDWGDEAISRTLAALPEAEVTVDYDGTVVIFSRAAGDEVDLVRALMPEIWMRGHTDLVKNANIRPKEIHFLFTREVEVRFDFKEVGAAQNATVTDERTVDSRLMRNVLQVPDYATDGVPVLDSNGKDTGNTDNGRPRLINNSILPQGSWADVDDYIRALPNLPLIDVVRKIDHDILQRAFIPQMDMWSALGLVGTLPDTEANRLSNWVGRIHAFQTHYRQTFRINSPWMDRILSIRAYRLATIDPQSGQRGPAAAYGDFCILPSQRSRYRNIFAGKPQVYAINKTAYPSGANEYLDATALTSPGFVHIVDHDQGIIRVDYVIDQTRSYEMVLPSQMAASSFPVADLTQRSKPIAFNAVFNLTDPPRLSSSFKMAVILTAVPASPNNNQQLHRIVIKPQDVKPLLPDKAQRGLDEANGPTMEVRIGADVEVARIRWLDTESVTIEQIFGLTPVPRDHQAQLAFSQKVSALCINEGSTSFVGGASLNSIARAEAASIYGSLADRYEGEMTAHMNGNVHLAGWAESITHSYSDEGETFTKVVFPRAVPQMSMFSFLSKNERAVILRLVQPL